MTEEQLKYGEVLLSIIKNTEAELMNLESFYLDVTTRFRKRDNKIDDGLYNLYISQHKDGSGFKVELSRYGGNLELLKVIIEELKRQLEVYKDEFKKL